MEKVNIYDIEGNIRESTKLPEIFKIKPRKDLIGKAFEASQSHKKQPQGREKRAGLKNTAEGWGTGHGMSRTPRIKGSGFPTARSGGRVPFAKGGRLTHPTKAEKKIRKKINKASNKKSIVSAISASGKRYWIEKRGHLIDNVPEIPLVLDDKIQTIKKTKQIYSLLCNLGLKEELDKTKRKVKKVRAGKGKSRGRKYKGSKSVLFLIKDDFGISKAARNIPGVDVIQFNNLSIDDIAPGGASGRLIIWSQSAFNELNNIGVRD